MNGYVMVGTNDLVSAKKFYDRLLSILSIKAIYNDDICIGYANDGNDDVEFYVTKPANGEPATYGNGTQVSFLTENRTQVEKFHETGLELGGKSEGNPGLRPSDGEVYYSYIRDLEGNKVCAYTNSID